MDGGDRIKRGKSSQLDDFGAIGVERFLEYGRETGVSDQDPPGLLRSKPGTPRFDTVSDTSRWWRRCSTTKDSQLAHTFHSINYRR